MSRDDFGTARLESQLAGRGFGGTGGAGASGSAARLLPNPPFGLKAFARCVGSACFLLRCGVNKEDSGTFQSF